MRINRFKIAAVLSLSLAVSVSSALSAFVIGGTDSEIVFIDPMVDSVEQGLQSRYKLFFVDPEQEIQGFQYYQEASGDKVLVGDTLTVPLVFDNKLYNDQYLPNYYDTDGAPHLRIDLAFYSGVGYDGLNSSSIYLQMNEAGMTERDALRRIYLFDGANPDYSDNVVRFNSNTNATSVSLDIPLEPDASDIFDIRNIFTFMSKEFFDKPVSNNTVHFKLVFDLNKVDGATGYCTDSTIVDKLFDGYLTVTWEPVPLSSVPAVRS